MRYVHGQILVNALSALYRFAEATTGVTTVNRLRSDGSAYTHDENRAEALVCMNRHIHNVQDLICSLEE